MSDSILIRVKNSVLRNGQATSKMMGRILRKRARSIPAIGYVLISLAVLGAVLLVRAQGWLQKPELIAYDRFVNERMRPNIKAPPDPDIRLVGMTEEDLKTLGFPIDDALLAEILIKLDAQEPAVIGLDMYRDLPEPRVQDKQAEGYQAKFAAALKDHPRIIAITRIGYVAGPPALKDDPDRVSANNLLKDPTDGVYRRGPLICEKNDVPEPIPSLSFMMAIRFLESKGQSWNQVQTDDPQRPLIRLGKTIIPRLTPDAGGYVGLKELDYSYLVDFERPLNYAVRDNSDARDPLGQAGKDTPFDLSFGDILRGHFKPEDLKGKIILVATVMQSIKDSNPTPIHDNLRGVHQHAMMTRQLLDAAFLGKAPMTWWPEWGEILWIAGCTLAGGALGLWLRTPLKLVPALAALLATIYFSAQFAFHHGVWILLAAPAIGALLASALVTSFVVALERADRRVVQSLFSKHVSKKVADAVFEQREQFFEGGKMAPRSFTGTVLFTDLAGFSTASETLTAEQVMRWLNAYMEVMAGLVESYEGTVNKYIGDAIMAVFGAPIIHQDDVGINADAVRAVRCALHMRREVPILNAKWRESEPDMPSVAMRIGIFTGPLVDGSFGSAERLEWTVIGDTVNRANRLEAAGKEIKEQLTHDEALCSILIGPEVYERVGDYFVTVPVPDMPLKGISERVTVYRVLSERASELPPNPLPSKPK